MEYKYRNSSYPRLQWTISGVAVVKNQIYVCGGFNGSLRVRTVDVYDPVKDVWTTVRDMDARRSTLGAAVLDGMVYAVGGFDGSTGKKGITETGFLSPNYKMFIIPARLYGL